MIGILLQRISVNLIQTNVTDAVKTLPQGYLILTCPVLRRKKKRKRTNFDRSWFERTSHWPSWTNAARMCMLIKVYSRHTFSRLFVSSYTIILANKNFHTRVIVLSEGRSRNTDCTDTIGERIYVMWRHNIIIIEFGVNQRSRDRCKTACDVSEDSATLRSTQCSV